MQADASGPVDSYSSGEDRAAGTGYVPSPFRGPSKNTRGNDSESDVDDAVNDSL